MLDLNYIRSHRETALKGLAKRGLRDAEKRVDTALGLDDIRRTTQHDLDQQSFGLKQLSEQIAHKIKSGDKDALEQLRSRAAPFKLNIKKISAELQVCEQQLHEVCCTLPNIPHASVPEGNSGADNVVVEEHGQPIHDTSMLPHWEIAKKQSLIDFELGNKLTGAGFPVYTGDGAYAQRRLINIFLDAGVKVGYTEVQPPIIVNETSAYSTGQLPDKEGQMYHITNENLYLIPTAEVPVTNLYRDKILTPADLPIKHIAYTPCFRREAGSWGSHVRGLNRLHQFDKVELVQISLPESSYDVLGVMCDYVGGLLTKLGLTWRKVLLCGGDLGFTSALTYDFEVWSPGQQLWLEVSSVSNFESYQANRLKLRFKDAAGRSHLLHTLNGSALALPRVMAALLEQHQGVEGILDICKTISIP